MEGEKEPSYLFLYSQSFLGIDPPWQFLVFCILPAILYLLCVYKVWPAVRPRSKEGIFLASRVRYYHNFFLCVYSGACCGFTTIYLWLHGEWGFVRLDGASMRPMLCTPASRGMTILNYTFIASKLYEMLDTMFIVFLKNDEARAVLRVADGVRNRTDGPPGVETRRDGGGGGSSGGPTKRATGTDGWAQTFLHQYHHCTTFWLFLIVANTPGSTKMGPLLNGFVHTLMYSLYTNPKAWPRAAVPFITMGQIAQLAFVTYVWWVVPNYCPAYSSYPELHFLEYLTPYFMVPVYLLFFIYFFFNRFIRPLAGPKSSTKQKTS